MGRSPEQVFFFKEMIDFDSGEELFRIDNEVRSVYHVDFMKPQVNRWPIDTDPFVDQRQRSR